MYHALNHQGKPHLGLGLKNRIPCGFEVCERAAVVKSWIELIFGLPVSQSPQLKTRLPQPPVLQGRPRRWHETHPCNVAHRPGVKSTTAADTRERPQRFCGGRLCAGRSEC